MFPAAVFTTVFGGVNICMVTRALPDSAKEDGKLSVFKVSDLRGWNSWCARFALVFRAGLSSSEKFCLHWLLDKYLKYWQSRRTNLLASKQNSFWSLKIDCVLQLKLYYQEKKDVK